MPTAPPRRKVALFVALGVGLGLAAAPAAFAMFGRAPKGATMIDEFRPYMTRGQIEGFQRDLRIIDDALVETRASVATPPSPSDPYAVFTQKWPAINADMSDMLTTMHNDLDNYAAVDALPSFKLFPWFFVLPGLAIAGISVWALRSHGGYRAPYVALAIAGLGVVLAPAVFQMFTRAPKGSEMIDDFRPLMTTTKVQTIQGYFLVIGGGEGTLRNQMLPNLTATQKASLPAVARFSQEWPRISNEMAPMIGAMSDNVGNFQAVDALPSFWLFPWFFVVPGLTVVVAAIVAERSPEDPTSPDQPSSIVKGNP